ncbi:hypothetical protein ADUPG1_013608 [Aduncisulcus paluster]|uniref:Uncharacterized protein n=1 Tax=Aduncisulcus paluster TaxID=2918883 RepID=A0ABQ5K3I6_9EUKA|nr:hypothetical protein ADUPG1_013608 [Aduncisulcus paluster]
MSWNGLSSSVPIRIDVLRCGVRGDQAPPQVDIPTPILEPPVAPEPADVRPLLTQEQILEQLDANWQNIMSWNGLSSSVPIRIDVLRCGVRGDQAPPQVDIPTPILEPPVAPEPADVRPLLTQEQILEQLDANWRGFLAHPTDETITSVLLNMWAKIADGKRSRREQDIVLASVPPEFRACSNAFHDIESRQEVPMVTITHQVPCDIVGQVSSRLHAIIPALIREIRSHQPE